MIKNNNNLIIKKIANETEVKAQIKLKFSNLSGNQLVATRSIQSTQKKNSITQKTLESVLMYKDPKTGDVNIFILIIII